MFKPDLYVTFTKWNNIYNEIYKYINFFIINIVNIIWKIINYILVIKY